jgi:tetratricopeptide (TPR) repeat protein
MQNANCKMQIGLAKRGRGDARFLFHFAICILHFAFCNSVRAEDTIRYRDHKTGKEAPSVSGTIVEESPAQLVYKPAGAATGEIPATDIIDVTYDVPGSARLTYRSAQGDERKTLDASVKDEDRKKAFNDALKSYREILPRLTGEKSTLAERHVQYKIARLLATRAEEDPAHREPAMTALAKFIKDHPGGWQISHAAKLLAQLQMDMGNLDGARATYEQLRGTANIPKSVRQDCELGIVDTLIRGNKFAQAEAGLQALRKSAPPNDPQVARVSVYQAKCVGASGKLAEAVTQLEGMIAKTTDKALKALAYNALGDCYRLNGKPNEALWPYLWVDVIYHQDRQEHVKAMAELARLFEAQGDAVRAKEYKDRLRKEAR